MNIDEETGKKIEELQSLENSMQGFLMQKQNMQIELNEITNASEEVKNSKEDVFKIVGGVMIRVDKDKVYAELTEKKKVLELRKSSIEKQEAILEDKAEILRKDINDSLIKKK